MSRRQLSPAATVFVILLLPLAVPVLLVLLGPSADRARAQELGPKQGFVPPSRTSEAPMNSGAAARRAVNARSRTKAVATATPSKPSGKMEFVPESPAPRANRPMPTARSAANAVVRRQVPAEPAKVADAKPTPQAAPRLKAPSINTLPPPIPEPVAEPAFEPVVEVEQAAPQFAKPVQIAKQNIAKKELEVPDREPEPVIVEEPEVVVSSQPDPPAEFSERPEPLLPDFELPIVRSTPRQAPMLEEVVEEEMPAARPGRDVVQLYFEEENPAADDANESMDLAEREANEPMEVTESESSLKELSETSVELTRAAEIQNAVAQVKPAETPAVTEAVSQGEEVQAPSADVLAELKPVRSIEIRKAVEVPQLAETENPQLREPADQARAMLRKRPPYKFWPVYRDPWTASRDSYAFHHNPLWFEEPNLERCGRGHGHLTSAASALYFSANIAFLPYRMTAEPCWSCVRTLPDCTVCQKFGHDAYLPPWSWRAAAVQAGAVVGCIYAIP